MYKVAICDDEVKLGVDLEETLSCIFKKLKTACEIDVYLTGEEICEGIKGGLFYDLIFLDINFAKSNFSGIAVGEFIRESWQNNKSSIVYMSWDKNYAMELFKIRPLDFLIKPLDNNKVESTVKTFLQLSRDWERDFIFKKGHSTFKVRLNDIMYLESQNRKIIINLTQGRQEEFYGSLKRTYEEQLDGLDFIFVNASYIVNYDYISSINYKELFVKDNPMPVSISQKRREEIREMYFGILKRRGKSI